MRKQLVIGVSILALTGLGGVSENYVSTKLQGASPQYTHFVRTSLGLPYRTNYQTAGVYFITGNKDMDFNNEDAKNNDFSDPTGDNCKRLGYSITSCASGLFNRACPYNDKLYDRCCDAIYKYTAAQCSSPKRLSSDSCGGKYRCYCDTAAYPYPACNSPQIKGNSCSDDTGTRYATCVCPNANNGQWGCKEYYAAPCNNICKTPYPDNCHNRTSVQTPYGCETYFSDCKSKCQKAYADNCRNRTAVSAPYGCKQAFGDCQSKCEIAYTDNCHNRSAVISSCPSNASCSYFSDCQSKIQSWSCNSGYTKSGNSCVADCSAGSILYSDKTCSISSVNYNKTAVAVVFDPVAKLAISLDESSGSALKYPRRVSSFSADCSWCSAGKWTVLTPTAFSSLYKVRGDVNVALMRLSKPQLYSANGGLCVQRDDKVFASWGNQSGGIESIGSIVPCGGRYVIKY